ncbi:16S rRNA (guanine(966)-N(2))-methyltransferase RsmD [Methylomonas sp. MgM2]
MPKAAAINKLRIIGGEWRSRVITFDDAPGLRPTPSRVRETLFNWLHADVPGCRCLDLFAGSGALGFEAASRGAAYVLQVENNLKTCQNLRRNAVELKADRIEIVHADVRNFVPDYPDSFDLIFLDPPFAQGLVEPICREIARGELLKLYGKIYIETEKNLRLDGMPENWSPLKQKTAGDVRYSLYQRR